ncbi:uncharacterized protein LOC134466063 [Engraulis encrasicolus]|uniref:uncharacterized protein LOC134466063 n=1 Tax=Engraulis encrasicolus TaxID=184585 RepID=UPI002FD01300
MAQLDCSGNTCTECPETQASPSEPVGVASPECVVEPPRCPVQENTIESVAEHDSGYIAESISDNSEPSDIKEDQVAKKEASSTLEELECTILPSPADEDIAATAYCPFSVKENSVETATQKPSATEVALSATPPPAEVLRPPVPSKGPDSDNRAECSETEESTGLQVDVVEPVSARYSACKITELLTSEPVEDCGQKSVPLVSTPSEERMSGTGPASPTLEPVVAHMQCPCAISGSDEPEVCEVESRLPGSPGLGTEEEPAVEKPAVDEALSATPAIPASPPVMAHLPVERPCKSPIQKLFEDLKIAEIVVPEQTEFVSAGGVVEAGQASPDRLSQEAVSGNKVNDDVRAVMEAPVPAPAAVPVEPLPRPAVTSDSFEALMSSESCARVISPMLEHTMILKSLVANSVQRNSVSIPAPAERAMSPALSRKGSAMSGSVSVHNQFSGLALGQSAAGGEERPQRYSLDSSNITWPPAASPSNNVANGSIQDNAQQDNNDNTTGQRGRGSPSNNDSVIQSSVNQMWTLFHLPHVSEDGTFSTEILTQPPFNGSAYIRSFGPGHVLLAKRSPTPSQDDLRTATGGTPEHLTQASNLQYQEHHPHNQQRPLHDVGPAVKDATEFLQPTSASGKGTLEISLPNFLLCIDNGQQATPLMGSTLPVPAQAVRVRRDEASGLLAFTVPMESVSSSQSRKRQVQFLPITTEQGQSVYSPAVLRIVTHPPDQPPK